MVALVSVIVPTTSLTLPTSAKRWRQSSARLGQLGGHRGGRWFGGTDRDAEKLTAVDPRITLVRAPKGGISRARNLGLEHVGANCRVLGLRRYYYPHTCLVPCAPSPNTRRWWPPTGAIAVSWAPTRSRSRSTLSRGRPTATRPVGRNRPSSRARRPAPGGGGVGGFDPQFDRAQDQDLIFKLLGEGRAITSAPSPRRTAITTRTCPSTSSAAPGTVTGSWPPIESEHWRLGTPRPWPTSPSPEPGRRYDPAWAVSKALAAARSGDFRKAGRPGLLVHAAVPSQALRTAGSRAWRKLLSSAGRASSGRADRLPPPKDQVYHGRRARPRGDAHGPWSPW